MAIKFQYNKTSLQQQQKQLKMRERTLPTIKSKESALRLEVKKARREIDALNEQLEQGIQGYQDMVALWDEFDPTLVSVTDVKLSTKKIAGVVVPVLDNIDYEVKPFSLFSHPSWFAQGVELLKALATLGIEAEFLNLKLEEKDSVLVRGATSGVGIAFAKLLKGKFPNIHLTGTSRNLAKEEQLKVVGFDQVILEKDGVLHTKEQFDKVLDLVGPSAILDTFARTAEGGIICSCGLLGGQWTVPDFDPIEMLSRNLYLTTFASGNVSQDKLQALVDFVEQYRVDVRTEKVYQIDQIQEAHAYLEGSHSFGKVIVKNEED